MFPKTEGQAKLMVILLFVTFAAGIAALIYFGVNMRRLVSE